MNVFIIKLVAKKRIGKRTRFLARFHELCIVLLTCLSVCVLFSLRPAVVSDGPVFGNLRYHFDGWNGSRMILPPMGPLFRTTLKTRTKSSPDYVGGGSDTQQQHRYEPSRVLIIAAAPRSIKHIVSLWSSLECFTADVNHVAISAPFWSQQIVERFIEEAKEKIPSFASGKATLEGMVAINDRYDVGLWCDALSQMGVDGAGGDNHKILQSSSTSYDEISLLNDSIFAMREYNEIFSALGGKNVSMTSLNYSFIHPKGTGDEYYWLESVWRGFDREGIRTFARYSCRPVSDPLFCSNAWWGKKGCIVENFERAMARQFPRDKTFGIFPSDVPRDMLTWTNSFPSWVRNTLYWNKLVDEQNFPVSKVNWDEMIDSIDDDRLTTCTKHLDRLWLEGFDFSNAKSAI